MNFLKDVFFSEKEPKNANNDNEYKNCLKTYCWSVENSYKSELEVSRLSFRLFSVKNTEMDSLKLLNSKSLDGFMDPALEGYLGDFLSCASKKYLFNMAIVKDEKEIQKIKSLDKFCTEKRINNSFKYLLIPGNKKDFFIYGKKFLNTIKQICESNESLIVKTQKHNFTSVLVLQLLLMTHKETFGKIAKRKVDPALYVFKLVKWLLKFESSRKDLMKTNILSLLFKVSLKQEERNGVFIEKELAAALISEIIDLSLQSKPAEIYPFLNKGKVFEKFIKDFENQNEIEKEKNQRVKIFVSPYISERKVSTIYNVLLYEHVTGKERFLKSVLNNKFYENVERVILSNYKLDERKKYFSKEYFKSHKQLVYLGLGKSGKFGKSFNFKCGENDKTEKEILEDYLKGRGNREFFFENIDPFSSLLQILINLSFISYEKKKPTSKKSENVKPESVITNIEPLLSVKRLYEKIVDNKFRFDVLQQILLLMSYNDENFKLVSQKIPISFLVKSVPFANEPLLHSIKKIFEYTFQTDKDSRSGNLVLLKELLEFKNYSKVDVYRNSSLVFKGCCEILLVLKDETDLLVESGVVKSLFVTFSDISALLAKRTPFVVKNKFNDILFLKLKEDPQKMIAFLEIIQTIIDAGGRTKEIFDKTVDFHEARIFYEFKEYRKPALKILNNFLLIKGVTDCTEFILENGCRSEKSYFYFQNLISLLKTKWLGVKKMGNVAYLRETKKLIRFDLPGLDEFIKDINLNRTKNSQEFLKVDGKENSKTRFYLENASLFLGFESSRKWSFFCMIFDLVIVLLKIQRKKKIKLFGPFDFKKFNAILIESNLFDSDFSLNVTDLLVNIMTETLSNSKIKSFKVVHNEQIPEILFDLVKLIKNPASKKLILTHVLRRFNEILDPKSKGLKNENVFINKEKFTRNGVMGKVLQIIAEEKIDYKKGDLNQCYNEIVKNLFGHYASKKEMVGIFKNCEDGHSFCRTLRKAAECHPTCFMFEFGATNRKKAFIEISPSCVWPDSYTMSFWIYIEKMNLNATQTLKIFSFYERYTGKNLAKLYFKNSKIAFMCRNRLFFPDINVEQKRWTNIVIVNDSSKGVKGVKTKFYVNAAPKYFENWALKDVERKESLLFRGVFGSKDNESKSAFWRLANVSLYTRLFGMDQVKELFYNGVSKPYSAQKSGVLKTLPVLHYGENFDHRKNEAVLGDGVVPIRAINVVDSIRKLGGPILILELLRRANSKMAFTLVLKTLIWLLYRNAKNLMIMSNKNGYLVLSRIIKDRIEFFDKESMMSILALVEGRDPFSYDMDYSEKGPLLFYKSNDFKRIKLSIFGEKPETSSKIIKTRLRSTFETSKRNVVISNRRRYTDPADVGSQVIICDDKEVVRNLTNEVDGRFERKMYNSLAVGKAKAFSPRLIANSPAFYDIASDFELWNHFSPNDKLVFVNWMIKLYEKSPSQKEVFEVAVDVADSGIIPLLRFGGTFEKIPHRSQPHSDINEAANWNLELSLKNNFHHRLIEDSLMKGKIFKDYKGLKDLIFSMILRGHSKKYFEIMLFYHARAIESAKKLKDDAKRKIEVILEVYIEVLSNLAENIKIADKKGVNSHISYFSFMSFIKSYYIFFQGNHLSDQICVKSISLLTFLLKDDFYRMFLNEMYIEKIFLECSKRDKVFLCLFALLIGSDIKYPTLMSETFSEETFEKLYLINSDLRNKKRGENDTLVTRIILKAISNDKDILNNKSGLNTAAANLFCRLYFECPKIKKMCYDLQHDFLVAMGRTNYISFCNSIKKTAHKSSEGDKKRNECMKETFSEKMADRKFKKAFFASIYTIPASNKSKRYLKLFLLQLCECAVTVMKTKNFPLKIEQGVNLINNAAFIMKRISMEYLEEYLDKNRQIDGDFDMDLFRVYLEVIREIKILRGKEKALEKLFPDSFFVPGNIFLISAMDLQWNLGQDFLKRVYVFLKLLFDFPKEIFPSLLPLFLNALIPNLTSKDNVIKSESRDILGILVRNTPNLKDEDFSEEIQLLSSGLNLLANSKLEDFDEWIETVYAKHKDAIDLKIEKLVKIKSVRLKDYLRKYKLKYEEKLKGVKKRENMESEKMRIFEKFSEEERTKRMETLLKKWKTLKFYETTQREFMQSNERKSFEDFEEKARSELRFLEFEKKTNEEKWMLDFTETSNRMRKKRTRDKDFEEVYQINEMVTDKYRGETKRNGKLEREISKQHTFSESDMIALEKRLGPTREREAPNFSEEKENEEELSRQNIMKFSSFFENDDIKGKVHLADAVLISFLERLNGIMAMCDTNLYFFEGFYSENQKILTEPPKNKRIFNAIKNPEDSTIRFYNKNHPQKTNQKEERKNPRFLKFSYRDIKRVEKRRYDLQNTAVEVFFKDNTNCLLVLKGIVQQIKSYDYIKKKISKRIMKNTRNKSLEMMQKWQNWELSNFDYLMYLNDLSGRTYNDLSQYPVMPWILSDYSSKNLDLEDKKVYRDLSKPMGALIPKRAKKFLERYEDWDEGATGVPKFHYGTHYSSPGGVLYYLLRMEPFSRQALEIQDGTFDVPDRIFSSVKKAWSTDSEVGMADVKELVPEFFYLPDFLRNKNMFAFGTTQSGDRVGDVELPTWACCSEKVFIRKHRAALEGEYVSRNLNHWIDLIFGYKQTGKEAVRAMNVFYYLTYEGSADISGIMEDENERESIKVQINSFGQTPKQLFWKPHSKRLKKPCRIGRMCLSENPNVKLKQYFPRKIEIFGEEPPGQMLYMEDTTYVLPSAQKIFSFEKNLIIECQSGSRDISLLVFECFGSSLKKKVKKIFYDVTDEPISILECSENGEFVAAAAEDLVIYLWRYSEEQDELEEVSRFFPHSSRISALKISLNFSLLVSGTEKGELFLWDINRKILFGEVGEKLKKVKFLDIDHEEGNIFACDGKGIFVWDSNGELIAKSGESDGFEKELFELSCLSINRENHYVGEKLIFGGTESGEIGIWRLCDVGPSDGLNLNSDETKQPLPMVLKLQNFQNTYGNKIVSIYSTAEKRGVLWAVNEKGVIIEGSNFWEVNQF